MTPLAHPRDVAADCRKALLAPEIAENDVVLMSIVALQQTLKLNCMRMGKINIHDCDGEMKVHCSCNYGWMRLKRRKAWMGEVGGAFTFSW